MRDLLCGKIMMRDVFTLGENQSVLEAARLMRDSCVGFAPVLDAAGRVSGVITDRDLAMRVLAEDKPSNTPLAQVMTRSLVSVRPDDSIRSAEDKMMMHKLHRVLVIDGEKKLAGVISVADLARAGEDGETAVIVATRSHKPMSGRPAPTR